MRGPSLLLFSIHVLLSVQLLHAEQQPACQPVNYVLCRIRGYDTWSEFNNTLGHKTIEDATAELAKFAYLFHEPTCHEYIQPFLCSLYLPNCPKAPNLEQVPRILLPCQNECIYARKFCEPILMRSGQTWPSFWDCNNFPDNQNDICFQKHHNNSTISLVCEDDLFDCKLRDPDDSDRKAICISKTFVCDGKRDCILPNRNVHEDGLDEIGCEPKCQEGQLQCDDVCLAKSDICNFIVDCSSGLDEVNCLDVYAVGLLYWIILIFALPCMAIYLLVRACNRVKEEPDMINSAAQQEHIYTPHQKPDLTMIFDNNPPIPVYDTSETYSVYERVNSGGYSGFSSIYNSYIHLPYAQGHGDDPREPPAPPPPTPAQQEIYLNTDQMSIMNHQ